MRKPLIDSVLTGAAGRVVHYEIAACGIFRAMAKALGHMQVVLLLEQILKGPTERKLLPTAPSPVSSPKNPEKLDDDDIAARVLRCKQCKTCEATC